MAGAKEMFQQIFSVFKDLSTVQKVAAVSVLAAVVIGLVMLNAGGGQTNYAVLYSSLNEDDAGEVVAKLKEMRVPYEITMNGTAIKVPADKVLETRLSLAGEGLPRGGGVGFEIFDRTSLGTTDFVQKLNYQRALQGELARTIRQFRQVKDARVHIATPKESVFVEDQKPPTASVSLTLRGGTTLTKKQVQAIVNLVACSVTGLSAENITVVDTAGHLLYRKSGDEESMLSATQFEYQLHLERRLRDKLETMFGQIVGPDKVIARVSSELEFNQVNTTEEVYDPEGQVVRSEQILNEESVAPGSKPKGIPGVKGELATYTEAGGKGSGGASNQRNNVTRNYEISKTVRNTREAVGRVKRLSVAIMVDGTYEHSVDKDGKEHIVYKPRSAEELKRFREMAMNAVGFDPDRGDRLEVVSMPFAASTAPAPGADNLEKWLGLLERLVTPFITLLVVVCFVFFVARPFFKLLSNKQLEEQRQAMLAAQARQEEEQESVEDERLKPVGLSDKERIYRLAQSDPDRAADLVRRWLREEGA